MHTTFSCRAMLTVMALLTILCATVGHAQSGQDAMNDDMVLTQWRFQPAESITAPIHEEAWVDVNLPFDWARYWEWEQGKMQEARRAGWVERVPQMLHMNNGWFARTITIPTEYTGRRFWLALDQIHNDAAVYVDGERVDEILGPEGRVDLTEHLTPGTPHTLRIWVTRWWNGVSLSMEQDVLRRTALYWRLGGRVERLVRQGKTREEAEAQVMQRRMVGGLTAPVRLEIRAPRAEVTDVFVQTSYRQKTLAVEIETLNHAAVNGRLELRVRDVTEPDEGTALPAIEQAVRLAGAGRKVHRLEVPWQNPRLWEIDDGYLYAADVVLRDDEGRVLHKVQPVRFGFREVWVEGRQLMLNGHPLRLRFTQLKPEREPMNPASITFMRSMGGNASYYTMPNDAEWWRQRGRRPELPFGDWKKMLEYADETGWAYFAPMPPMRAVKNVLDDPEAREAYRREARLFARRLRNHPSILAWALSMNTGTPAREDPEKLGQSRYHTDQALSPNKKWAVFGQNVMKELDPTRLRYHHSGQGGQFDFFNHYVNFMPLRERMAIPSYWAEHGDRPWGISEWGELYTASFAWGPVYRFTEHAAAYLGDEAYDLETPRFVKFQNDLIDQDRRQFKGVVRLKPREAATIRDETAYGAMQNLFVRQTNLAWRAYGVPMGWFPWTFQVGLGITPYHDYLHRKGEEVNFRYEHLRMKEAQAAHEEPPAWVNSLYHAYRDTLQPLLVTLAGRPERLHSRQRHFYAGETFRKTIMAVWDGPGDTDCSVDWSLTTDAGRTIVSDRESFDLSVGQIDRRTLELTAPDVNQRTDASLAVVVYGDQGEVIRRERFALTFRPKAQRLNTQSRWAIYDPQGTAADWLTSRDADMTHLESIEGFNADDYDVLLLGRNALESLRTAPFNTGDMANGLRVLMLEQSVSSLQGMGFRVTDIRPRRAFMRVSDHDALQGLQPIDLRDWRGRSTLLPPTNEGMHPWPVSHPPHWQNDDTVASVIIETPQHGAFTPIVECEFDLAYSPLLQWSHGAGQVIFCQFDVTDRLDRDPAADQLMGNLVRTLDASPRTAQNRTVVYHGGPRDHDYLRALGATVTEYDGSLDPAKHILVLGRDKTAAPPMTPDDLERFVLYGGIVLSMPADGRALRERMPADVSDQMEFATLEVPRVAPPQEPAALLRGMGPQLFRWRMFPQFTRFSASGDAANVHRYLDGLVLHVPRGRGHWIFSQIDPKKLQHDHATLKRVRWNTARYYQQLLTNLGAKTRHDLTRRLMSFAPAAPLVNIPQWRIYNGAFDTGTKPRDGKFPALGKTLPVELALGEKDEGEAAVIGEDIGEGETDDVQTGEGRWVSFGPRPDGFVHLNWVATPAVGKIGYARTYVYSSRAREAVMVMGADYWCQLLVNGEAVLDHGKSQRTGGAPDPADFTLRIPLQTGWNALEIKVASGAKGFGFWCRLSDPGDLRVEHGRRPTRPPADLPATHNLLAEPEPEAPSLFYSGLTSEPGDDPYTYRPW